MAACLREYRVQQREYLNEHRRQISCLQVPSYNNLCWTALARQRSTPTCSCFYPVERFGSGSMRGTSSSLSLVQAR